MMAPNLKNCTVPEKRLLKTQFLENCEVFQYRRCKTHDVARSYPKIITYDKTVVIYRISLMCI